MDSQGDGEAGQVNKQGEKPRPKIPPPGKGQLPAVRKLIEALNQSKPATEVLAEVAEPATD